MVEETAPREIAAAWRPELAGRRAAGDLGDSIVEPEWGGLRVAAALTDENASLWVDGSEVPAPRELLAALVDAFRAVDAVVEGCLTTSALRSDEGVQPRLPKVERPPALVPRVLRRGARNDPFIHAREHEARARELKPLVLDALEQGERHAFVATDLLWLDGQSLVDVPLLERKRHLEQVLEPSILVRVSPFVRPSAVMLLATWGSLGFTELTWRSSNARYLAGRENPDRALARPPGGPTGPSRGPVSPG